MLDAGESADFEVPMDADGAIPMLVGGNSATGTGTVSFAGMTVASGLGSQGRINPWFVSLGGASHGGGTQLLTITATGGPIGLLGVVFVGHADAAFSDGDATGTLHVSGTSATSNVMIGPASVTIDGRTITYSKVSALTYEATGENGALSIGAGGIVKIESAPVAATSTSTNFAGLALSAGATATVGRLNAVLSLASYNFDPASHLDLGANDLIVREGNLSDLTALLAEGRNQTPGGVADGRWNGTTGISSSAAAAADAGGFESRVLGINRNVDLLTGPRDSFDGAAVNPGDVLIKYTYNGDIDLDGRVDDNDVTLLGLFYDGGAVGGRGWVAGDFNGDGKVDDVDVTIMGLVYGAGA